jgi:hypothetical protein
LPAVVGAGRACDSWAWSASGEQARTALAMTMWLGVRGMIGA